MPKGKSSGHHGLTKEFYGTFWGQFKIISY